MGSVQLVPTIERCRRGSEEGEKELTALSPIGRGWAPKMTGSWRKDERHLRTLRLSLSVAVRKMEECIKLWKDQVHQGEGSWIKESGE